MNIIPVIIWIVLGIHKNKGYSPIAGFCWGFFVSIIGLSVVLLEKTKEEHDMEMTNQKGLSMWQWMAIFLGIGIVLIIIFFMVMGSL